MATKKTTKPPKPVVLKPKMSKKKQKKEEPLKTKRSVIVHKKEENIQDLYQVLGELERTIQELSRIYSELPDSRHRGVGGRMKPTLKQEQIARQIEQAQARADRIMKLIEKLESK